MNYNDINHLNYNDIINNNKVIDNFKDIEECDFKTSLDKSLY